MARHLPDNRRIFLLAALLLLLCAGVWLFYDAIAVPPEQGAVAASSPPSSPAGAPAVSGAGALPGGAAAVTAPSAASLCQRGPFQLLEHRPGCLRVRFDLPEYHVHAVVDSAGNEWQAIDAPSAPGILSVAGAPSLPAWRTELALPPDVVPRMEVLSGAVATEFLVGVVPPPSAGPQLMTGDADDAPPATTGAAYAAGGGTWPSQIVAMTEAYQLRKVGGVGVTVMPFRYDATRGGVSVTKSVEVLLEWEEDEALPLLDGDADFAFVQSRQFLNAPMLASDLAEANDCGHLLVVVPSAWCDDDTLKRFAHWKEQLGFRLTFLRYPDDTGEGASALKASLQSRYDDEATGAFTHLLLLGDYDALPSYYHNASAEVAISSEAYAQVASDTPYALLAGEEDRLYMDAFLSRLPVADKEALAASLERLMETERGEVPEASSLQWPGRALFLADNAKDSTPRHPYVGAKNYSDSDFLRVQADDEHLGGVMTECAAIFQDDSAFNASGVSAAMNAGPSLVTYLGHGDCDALKYSSWRLFTSTHAQALANGSSRSFVHIPVCHCGNLEHGTAEDKHDGHKADGELCLAAALLNPADGSSGAAAVIAATNETYWHPPMIQIEEMTALLMTAADGDAERPLSDGAYFLTALNAAVTYCSTYYATYGAVGYDKRYAAHHAHVMHLYGDCSALPRILPYRMVKVEATDGVATVTAGVAGSPLANATLSLEYVSEDGCGRFAARTDEEGRVHLPTGCTGILRLADAATPVREMLVVAGGSLAAAGAISDDAMRQWLDSWRKSVKEAPVEAVDAHERLREDALALWRGGQGAAATSSERQNIVLEGCRNQLVALSLYPDAPSLERLAQALASCYRWDMATGVFQECVPMTPAGYVATANEPCVLELTGIRESTTGITSCPTAWQLVAPQHEATPPAPATLFDIDGDAWRQLPADTQLQPGTAYWLH